MVIVSRSMFLSESHRELHVREFMDSAKRIIVFLGNWSVGDGKIVYQHRA